MRRLWQLLFILVFGSLLGLALFSFIRHLYFTPPSPNQTATQSAQLLPSPSPSPPDPFAHWQLYQNPKYDYQFRYDPAWTITDVFPDSPQYDHLLIQGDLSQKNWPSIEINLPEFDPPPITVDDIYQTLQELFGPTQNITTTNFGRDEIYAAVKKDPATPQSPATETYYFLHKGLVFSIKFSDTSSPQAHAIYNRFLAEFDLL